MSGRIDLVGPRAASRVRLHAAVVPRSMRPRLPKEPPTRSGGSGSDLAQWRGAHGPRPDPDIATGSAMCVDERLRYFLRCKDRPSSHYVAAGPDSVATGGSQEPFPIHVPCPLDSGADSPASAHNGSVRSNLTPALARDNQNDAVSPGLINCHSLEMSPRSRARSRLTTSRKRARHQSPRKTASM